MTKKKAKERDLSEAAGATKDKGEVRCAKNCKTEVPSPTLWTQKTSGTPCIGGKLSLL